ncbi:MAG TPA: hypothetical protein VF169_24285 [Albitalea sp.]|uniref:hypothetical protein n=1 Tax=Piscinibacter sp. TaxID=1903157 RepID=UPI002ED1F599
MAIPLVPVKTPDGHAELSQRQRRLSQRHRTVLLLVDGRRTEVEVRQLARQAGATDTCFGELIDMGLILLPQPTVPMTPMAPAVSHLHVDIPLEAHESLLPAARTLQPESVLDEGVDSSVPGPDSVLGEFDADADPSLEEAREILVRALRTEAPLAGSLTLLRLRRARTRDELAGLIDDVEAHIVKPFRSLSAQQTLRRARHLLAPRIDSKLSTG